MVLTGSGGLVLAGRPMPRASLALSGSGSLTFTGSTGVQHHFSAVVLTGSGRLVLVGGSDPVAISRALVTIYYGEGAAFVRAFHPGDLVPETVVESRNLHDLTYPDLVDRAPIDL